MLKYIKIVKKFKEKCQQPVEIYLNTIINKNKIDKVKTVINHSWDLSKIFKLLKILNLQIKNWLKYH